jgi:hypothetical protein
MTISSASRVGALCAALTAVRAELSVVMRQITDPSPTAVGSWSIGETAQHLSGSAEYFLAAARGEASNARVLAANPERDPRVLADRFDATVHAARSGARVSTRPRP